MMELMAQKSPLSAITSDTKHLKQESEEKKKKQFQVVNSNIILQNAINGSKIRPVPCKRSLGITKWR